MKKILICTLLAIAACSPSQQSAKAADFPAKRCINLANALNAPTEGDWGYRIKKQHIEAAAKAGFDSIRIPIAWSEHTSMNAPFTIDPAFFSRVDEVVSQALDNGLMIVLDVHNFEELDNDPNLHTPRMRAIWQQIAWHYAKAPSSVAFEILNEPMGKMKGKRWEKLIRDVLADIRKSNPDRWVIVGGENWNSLDGLAKLNAPYDPKLVLTYHDYDPYEFTHQGASWFENAPPVGTVWGTTKEQSDIRARAARAARISQRTGMPVWLGEFGAHRRAPLPSRMDWSRQMRQAAEANDIGWCVFDFGGEFSFWSETNNDWNRPLLRALMGERNELRH